MGDLIHLGGHDNCFINQPHSHSDEYMDAMVTEEEVEYEGQFTVDEWKLLFMMLCENRAKLNLEEGLTDRGKDILTTLKSKVSRIVVGVG